VARLAIGRTRYYSASLMGSGPTTDAPQIETEVALQQAYLLLARRLRHIKQRICGLLPVPAHIEFEDVSRHLARALASLGGTVGIVAPHARWASDGVAPRLSISVGGEGIDSLTPVWTRKSSVRAVIEQTLDNVQDRYDFILVDLSGLTVVAAQEVASIPGICITLFAAAGQTNGFDLARVRRKLPQECLTGAVLMDQDKDATRTGSSGSSRDVRRGPRTDERRRPKAHKIELPSPDARTTRSR
jgi:hypothetical protein